MRTRWLPWVLLVVLAAVGLFFVWQHPGNRPMPGPRDSAVVTKPEDALRASGSDRTRLAEDGGEERGSVGGLVVGRCVDAVTSRRVQARISSGGLFITHADADGRFQVEARGGAILTFTFPGYRDQNLTLADEANREHRVELVPEEQCTILFLAGSEPVSGVEAELASEDDRSADPLTSDAEGKVVFALVRATEVNYHAPSGERGWCSVLPGEELVVPLGGPFREVRLVDTDGRPLVDVAVELSWGGLGAARRVMARSDRSGVVILPALRGAQQFSIELPDLWVMEVLEGDARLEVVHPRWRLGTWWAVTPLSADGSLVVRCDVEPIQFTIRDARSLLPVTATCEWAVESPRSDADTWYGFSGQGDERAVEDGSLRIPRNLLTVQLQTAEAEDRLTLWLDGFEPWSTAIAPGLLEGGEVPVNERAARVLRPVGPSGQPYRGKFRVLDPRHNVYLGDFVQADARGSTAPLRWSGAAWRILGLEGELLTEIPAGTLEKAQIVEVELPHQTGSIRFVDVPEEAPVPVAAFLRMRESSSGRMSSAHPGPTANEWLIDGLSPGEYMVGPRERVQWYGAPSTYSKNTYPSVTVASGEITEVKWKPEWLTDRQYRGRVQVLHGTAKTLKLFGLHGTGAHRRTPDGLSHRIPLDGAGRYVIPRGRVKPLALLVTTECTRGPTGWPGQIPLAVIGVGDDLQLDATPLRLHRSAEPLDDESLTVLLPSDLCVGPLERHVAILGIEALWPPGGPLELPFLAGRVSGVRVRCEHGTSGVITLSEDRRTPDGFVIREGDLPSPTEEK